MAKQNNEKETRGFKLNDDVREFLELNGCFECTPEKERKKTKKKFKKEFKGYSKKERQIEITERSVYCLPEVILTLTRYSRVPEVMKIKDDIYDILCSKKLIKEIKTQISENMDAIKNIKLLPCIVYDMVQTFAKKKAEILKENPNATVECEEIDRLIDLSKLIVKSKIKKLTKAGIDPDVAFDVVSILPDENMLKYNDKYRIALLLRSIYENAKTKEINIEKLMKVVVTKEFYPRVILTAMLEKRENYANMNENQQKAYCDITTWVFNTLEEFEKDAIMSILKKYVEIRKRDKDQNKDSARRFFLSALPESDYPEINKVMKKMIELDSTVEEFF